MRSCDGGIDGGLDRWEVFADQVPFDGSQHNDGYLAAREVLFLRDSLVSGQKNLEAVRLGSSEKLAVF